MTKIMTFDQFSRHMDRVVIEYPKYLSKEANLLGTELEKSAKEKIGYLQIGAGGFESWQPLAESTIADKERQGYLFKGDGNPLYRTGELMESISFVFNVASQTLFLGSTSEIMVYQELGTIHIPPRSVLALTMYKSLHFIAMSLAYFMVDWIRLRPLVKEVAIGSL